jgi:hypothetical protein
MRLGLTPDLWVRFEDVANTAMEFGQKAAFPMDIIHLLWFQAPLRGRCGIICVMSSKLYA